MSHREVTLVILDILNYSLESCINTRPLLHQMIIITSLTHCSQLRISLNLYV